MTNSAHLCFSPSRGLHAQHETLKRCCVRRTRTTKQEICGFPSLDTKRIYIHLGHCRSITVHGYSCVSLYSDMSVYCLTSVNSMRRTIQCEQEQRKSRLDHFVHFVIFSHVDFTSDNKPRSVLSWDLCWEPLLHGQSGLKQIRCDLYL